MLPAGLFAGTMQYRDLTSQRRYRILNIGLAGFGRANSRWGMAAKQSQKRWHAFRRHRGNHSAANDIGCKLISEQSTRASVGYCWS